MHAHLVGGGIASLAAAVFLIEDGGLAGADIHVYESGTLLGGALDAGGSPETGYTMRGGRMFEARDRCMHRLLSFIPSAGDPAKTIHDEIEAFHAAHGWHDKARLVGAGGRIVDAGKFGLSARNKLDLVALALTPEALLEGKTIGDCLDPSILDTNFWLMFGSIFAFMPWHGAVEMRRYLLRFIHLLPSMASMTTIQRTRLNQYESIVEPVTGWLRRRGVNFHLETLVTDIDFRRSDRAIAARRIHLLKDGRESAIELEPHDLVFVTNGSHVAAPSRGSMTSPPPPATTPRDGSWQLWERLAGRREGFGRPSAFNADTAKTAWITFTVTERGSRFTDLLARLTGSEEGRGGLVTLTDSNWLLTIVGFRNPHFARQPADIHLWWGYGLHLEKPGNFVAKPMPACTGAEILEETVRHLGFAAQLAEIREASICIPCLLPYAAGCLLPRRQGDRPAVVPAGSTNFAFIGEFAEIPDEAAFTTEYAARTAETAVASLLNLATPPPVYKGQFDPQVLLDAVKAMSA
jgi:oleate hydratase